MLCLINFQFKSVYSSSYKTSSLSSHVKINQFRQIHTDTPDYSTVKTWAPEKVYKFLENKFDDETVSPIKQYSQNKLNGKLLLTLDRSYMREFGWSNKI